MSMTRVKLFDNDTRPRRARGFFLLCVPQSRGRPRKVKGRRPGGGKIITAKMRKGKQGIFGLICQIDQHLLLDSDAPNTKESLAVADHERKGKDGACTHTREDMSVHVQEEIINMAF